MKTRFQSLAWLGVLRIPHCCDCDVGCRRGSDPELLWLWGRPAAIALIQPLAWEPPYATGVALNKKKEIQSLLNTKYIDLNFGSQSNTPT